MFEMAVATLIVMEPGSEWPGHVGDCENTIAVRGDEGGSPETVSLRLDSLRQTGQRVRYAVLACNESSSPASRARRWAMAQALLTAVMAAGFGRLVLTARDRISVAARCELLALAGDLSQGTRGGTATVSVRFGG
jgi:hypothetical protein